MQLLYHRPSETGGGGKTFSGPPQELLGILTQARAGGGASLSWTPATPLIAPYPESSSRRAVFREILFSDARSPHAGGGRGKRVGEAGADGGGEEPAPAVGEGEAPTPDRSAVLLA